MSTYIVAFANGPFVYLEDFYESPLSQTRHQLRIYGKRVYHSPNLYHGFIVLLRYSNPGFDRTRSFRLGRDKEGSTGVRTNVWDRVPPSKVGYLDRRFGFLYVLVIVLRIFRPPILLPAQWKTGAL